MPGGSYGGATGSFGNAKKKWGGSMMAGETAPWRGGNVNVRNPSKVLGRRTSEMARNKITAWVACRYRFFQVQPVRYVFRQTASTERCLEQLTAFLEKGNGYFKIFLQGDFAGRNERFRRPSWKRVQRYLTASAYNVYGMGKKFSTDDANIKDDNALAIAADGE